MDAPSVSTSLTLGPSMELDEVILDLHGVSPLSMGGEGRGHGLATLWLVSGVVFVTCLVIIVHLTLEKHITYSIHTSIHRYIASTSKTVPSRDILCVFFKLIDPCARACPSLLAQALAQAHLMTYHVLLLLAHLVSGQESWESIR